MDRYLFRPDHLKFVSRDEKAASLLGVALNASLDDVRAAYRRRARETHPDRRANRDVSAFLEVQSAYDWLTDAANRRRGDAARTTERCDTILVSGQRIARWWDTISPGYQFSFLAAGVECFFHVRGKPSATFIDERQLVQGPSAHRKLFPSTYVVLHGLLFQVTRPNGRLLAMDLAYLDPASLSPYAIVERRRSWLLVRQPDGRLLAQNSRRGFSRLGGYAAFSDASGFVEPIGTRLFPPFEAPLVI
ncbi:MAG: DnaJ domain [Thermoanaerobaculia bacterium]|jgi:hypothetical protein|nr:DnaJ domain [Thermoanaerobaculia bacterium]